MKKEETQDVQDITELSFYKCQEIIREVTAMVAEGDGELTEEQAETLTKAYTQSIVKLHSMCNFIKLMERKIEICKERKKEINDAQKHAERTIDRIKSFLAPWVVEQGKSYHVEEYELKTRKSTAVELDPDFADPLFCSIETKKVVTPDKAAIKEALLAGEEVKGARLVERQNLKIV